MFLDYVKKGSNFAHDIPSFDEQLEKRDTELMAAVERTNATDFNTPIMSTATSATTDNNTVVAATAAAAVSASDTGIKSTASATTHLVSGISISITSAPIRSRKNKPKTVELTHLKQNKVQG